MAGRPSEYNPEYCAQIIECGKKGMGVEETCVVLGFSDDSWYRWSDPEHETFKPEFREAVNAWRLEMKAWWHAQGRENLKERDFNARLYELNMMNRLGWNKKEQRDETHTGTVTIVTKVPEPL